MGQTAREKVRPWKAGEREGVGRIFPFWPVQPSKRGGEMIARGRRRSGERGGDNEVPNSVGEGGGGGGGELDKGEEEEAIGGRAQGVKKVAGMEPKEEEGPGARWRGRGSISSYSICAVP